MAAPKTEGQIADNALARVLSRLEKEAKVVVKLAKQRGELSPEDAARLERGVDSLVEIQTMGLRRIIENSKVKDKQLRRTNEGFIFLTMGFLAKFQHVELTQAEQQTNIGQVFVAIKQFSEKPAIEDKRKTLEPEIVE